MGRQHSAGTCAHTVARGGGGGNSPESASRRLSWTDKCLFEPTHQAVVPTVVCMKPKFFIFSDPYVTAFKHTWQTLRTQKPTETSEKCLVYMKRAVLVGNARSEIKMKLQDSRSDCQFEHCCHLQLNTG